MGQLVGLHLLFSCASFSFSSFLPRTRSLALKPCPGALQAPPKAEGRKEGSLDAGRNHRTPVLQQNQPREAGPRCPSHTHATYRDTQTYTHRHAHIDTQTRTDIHIHMCTQTRTHRHACTHRDTHVHTHRHACTHTQICTHRHTHRHIDTQTHTQIHSRTCTQTCMHTYTDIHT